MRDARADGKSDILAPDAVVSASQIHRHRFHRSTGTEKKTAPRIRKPGSQEQVRIWTASRRLAVERNRKFFSWDAGSSFPLIQISWLPGFQILNREAMPETHTGQCYCGAVEIEVHGDPLDMGYCHCENCRRYSAAPVSAFTLWKWENVNLTKGAEFLGRFKSSEISDRRYCTKCGSHISVDHPTLGLIDVRIGALRNFPFKPKVHLNYAETILPIKDGLPKLKDFPAEIGGSGETLPE